MKTAIRRQVIRERDGLTPQERHIKSLEIEDRLFRLQEFLGARTVMFFASFRSEVETLPMIRRALSDGKRIILPKIKGKKLALFEIRDFERDIAPGAWDIPEPREDMHASLDEIDLLITPGIAFDERGNRIGYGAGFYDDLLVGYGGMTVALAFEVQIVPDVPVDVHDVPVKKIVTERRIINPKS